MYLANVLRPIYWFVTGRSKKEDDIKNSKIFRSMLLSIFHHLKESILDSIWLDLMLKSNLNASSNSIIFNFLTKAGNTLKLNCDRDSTDEMMYIDDLFSLLLHILSHSQELQRIFSLH